MAELLLEQEHCEINGDPGNAGRFALPFFYTIKFTREQAKRGAGGTVVSVRGKR